MLKISFGELHVVLKDEGVGVKDFPQIAEIEIKMRLV